MTNTPSGPTVGGGIDPESKAPADPSRETLQAHWLQLTRHTLPDLAQTRDWPVRADHCFQRILLDNACGGIWYDHIAGRPAYRHAPREMLAAAVALGEAVIAGTADLVTLNRRSLTWRNAAPA